MSKQAFSITDFFLTQQEWKKIFCSITDHDFWGFPSKKKYYSFIWISMGGAVLLYYMAMGIIGTTTAVTDHISDSYYLRMMAHHSSQMQQLNRENHPHQTLQRLYVEHNGEMLLNYQQKILTPSGKEAGQRIVRGSALQEEMQNTQAHPHQRQMN